MPNAREPDLMFIEGGGRADPNPDLGWFFNRPRQQGIWVGAKLEAAPKVEGKRGEELFQLILSGIREIYEIDGIIAGGAVRDVAAGVQDHKDVDVFLPIPYKTFQKGYNELGWQGFLERIPAKDYKGHDNPLFKNSSRARTLVQNKRIDLIFLTEPLSKESVDTFPVHAQRGIWTLAGGQEISPEALEDIVNKKFTIDPTIDSKEKIERLKTKINGWKKREGYKDWKIVEPTIKEWWEGVE